MVDQGTTVSAVIPAFNEAAAIRRVVQEVSGFVDEVLVVDDGSQDQTAAVAHSSGAEVHRHEANEGYIASIKDGFRLTSGEVIVTLDADGEFSPEEIPSLVAPILDGQADMVQGARQRVPRPSEAFISWFTSLFSEVGDSGTGFRALRRSLAETLEIRGFCICGVLALEAARRGARIVDVPIELRTGPDRRKIAWQHVPQIGFVMLELYRYFRQRSEFEAR